jgi:hypothetical protein
MDRGALIRLAAREGHQPAADTQRTCGGACALGEVQDRCAPVAVDFACQTSSAHSCVRRRWSTSRHDG